MEPMERSLAGEGDVFHPREKTRDREKRATNAFAARKMC